jgi:hypothetical protein
MESHKLESFDTLLSQAYDAANRWQSEECIRLCLKTLEFKDSPEAYEMLACCYYQIGEINLMWESINKGIKLFPTSNILLFQRGLQNLNRQEWSDGWSDWQYRLSRRIHLQKISQFLPTVPEWDGKKPGKLLVIGEHGLGDQILFCRYLKNIQNDVVFLTREPLRRLMEINSRNLGISEVISDSSIIPPVNYWIGIESLPHLLQDTLPQKLDGYLLGVLSRGDKIGICWQSSNAPEPYRSIEWNDFSPIIETNHQFISLQFQNKCPNPTVDSTGILACKDLMDTSYLMDTVKMVITTDTCVAHLSAAKGIPTLVLRPKPAEWRLSNQEYSPFYSNVKVFHQKQKGIWSEPIDEVISHLKNV